MIRGALLSALLLGLTLWAYQSTCSAGWVYEDRAAMTTAAQAATGGWTQARSLSVWTWRWTATPRSAHLMSLALHLVIGGCVGVLAWRVGLTPLGAWGAMAIWLLHPITVELAAYAKARADEIAVLGVLIAAIAATGRWWRGWALVGVVVGAAIAVGGKQAGVVVLLLVPLVIWAQRRRTQWEVPIWAPWWLPAVLAVQMVVAGVQWYGGLRALVNADGELGVGLATDVTWIQWLSAQAGAAWYWLLASLWPALLTPDADIDGLAPMTRAMGLYALGMLGLGAWVWRNRAPHVSLACAWVVCGVLPRLLVQTPRSYLSASQFAVAFVGLTLLAGLGIERIREQWTSPS